MTENIEVFKQNSIRINSRKGKIYIDPFQMDETPKDAAFIMITHDHHDHFSPEDIAKVANENTILIVPEKMEKKAGEVAKYVAKTVTVMPGVYRAVAGLEFETVPAYNLHKSYHPKKAEWVGYIIRLEDKRIYIAGDTDATKEAFDVRCSIALVPIGGTYTMDAKKAAELVNTIRPEVAIPVHYGSIVGKPEDAEVFKSLVRDNVKVEIKIK